MKKSIEMTIAAKTQNARCKGTMSKSKRSYADYCNRIKQNAATVIRIFLLFECLSEQISKEQTNDDLRKLGVGWKSHSLAMDQYDHKH